MAFTQRVLILTVLDGQGQQREFGCLFNKPEVSHHFVRDIIENGNILLAAHILEGSTSVSLPIDAFSDGSWVNVLQNFRDESQLFPVQMPDNDIDKQLVWQRITQYQAYILDLEKMRDQVMVFLQQTTDNFSAGPRKNRLTSRYQALIANLDSQLVQTNLLLEPALIRVMGQDHRDN